MSNRGLSFGIALSVLASAADIEGTVRVTKALTRKKVSLPQTYERSAALRVPEPPETGLAEELKRVVVFIDGRGPAAKGLAVSINQVNRRFEPDVVVVPAGSTVAFPNSDPVFHNVFSLSKPRQFDLGNYRAGESREVRFDQPGVVSVYCHLHPNMSAAVIVTPNGWYTRPAEDGSFSLKGIPPGRYSMVAWHKSAGSFRRTVEVPASGSAKVTFEIPIRTE